MTERPRLRALTPLLVVSDLQRAVDFFVRKLAFRDPRIWGEPPCFAMLHRDGLDLMLSRGEDATQVRPHGPTGVWDLFLTVGDVAAEQAALAEAGVPLDKGPTDTFYAMREIEIVDPDGHRICLAQDISGEPLLNADTYCGTLDVGSAKFRLVLKLSRAGDHLAGRLDSPDQNAANLPIDRVDLCDAKLTFSIKALDALFEGTFDADRRTLTGRWTQRGRTWPLAFTRE